VRWPDPKFGELEMRMGACPICADNGATSSTASNAEMAVLRID